MTKNVKDLVLVELPISVRYFFSKNIHQSAELPFKFKQF